MSIAGTARLERSTRWPSFNTDYLSSYLSRYVKITTLQIASHLTDPVCKSHELFRRIQIVDALHPTSMKVVNFSRKCFLGMGMFACACLATATTVPGILLRWAVCKMQQEPFIYWEGGLKEEKVLQDDQFTLYSQNICFINAGYVISDGGVMPWPFRINPTIENIKKQNADLVCLYEVFDIKAALELYRGLRNEYAHFYFNIGPRATGVSSGIFIASKFKVFDPKFTAFPKEFLIGRTKNAEKGVFEFDVENRGKRFARIFTTHLQHSEKYTSPTDQDQVAQRNASEERKARSQEMTLIMEKIAQVKNKAAILTGDLNLYYKDELQASWYQHFEEGDVENEETWGGDAFCAGLVGKKPSPSLKLDYSMILKGTAKAIRTRLIKTGFIATKFKREALSDHAGLLSLITLN